MPWCYRLSAWSRQMWFVRRTAAPLVSVVEEVPGQRCRHCIVIVCEDGKRSGGRAGHGSTRPVGRVLRWADGPGGELLPAPGAPADLPEHGSGATDGQGLGELLVAGRGGRPRRPARAAALPVPCRLRQFPGRRTDVLRGLRDVLLRLLGDRRWEALTCSPNDLPPKSAAYYYFAAWRDDGTDQTVHDLLPRTTRLGSANRFRLSRSCQPLPVVRAGTPTTAWMLWVSYHRSSERYRRAVCSPTGP